MLVSLVPKVKACTCAQPAPRALAAACRKCRSIRRIGRHRPRDVAERDKVRPARAPRPPAPAPAPRRRSAAPPAWCRASPPSRPARSTRVRRLAIGLTGSSSRAIARLRSQGELRRRHLLEVHLLELLRRREGERRVELHLLALPPAPAPAATRCRPAPPPPAAPPASAPGLSFSPRIIGVKRLIMCSRNCGSRQNSRNTCANTARCSGRLTKHACSVW